MGANAPHRPMIPKAMAGDTFVLEGHALRVIGPMQGDHVRSTIIWDNETRTLIAGDVVYNGMFVWLGEHKADRYAAWLKVLDNLEAMQPQRVIAGHTRPGITDDRAGLTWTRQYITAFALAAKTSKSAAQLEAAMHAKFPDAIDVYGCFLLHFEPGRDG